MISYALEVSICWCLFYLLYLVLLRRETFFSINRWYLTGTLLLGLLIPLLKIIPLSGTQTALNEPLLFIASGPEVFATSFVENGSSIPSMHWIWWVYFLGVLITSLRLFKGLYRIYKLYKSSEIIYHEHYQLIKTKEYHLPFSFLNGVFISEQLPLSKDIEKILKHELNHVQKKHTLDILFIEILGILFWWNPIVYLYKHALKETHEFMADASVLKETEEKIYGQILLRQSISGLEIALANQFFNSHFKKRVQMMYQQKSKRQNLFKYLFVIPFLGLMTIAFSSYVENDPEYIFDKTNIGSAEFYDIKDARSGDVIGLTSPIIAENYYLRTASNDVNIYAYGELVVGPLKDVLDIKSGHCVHFDPKESGHYYITKNESSKAEDVKDSEGQEDPIFKVVEEMPRFPGCEDIKGSIKEKTDCSNQKLIEYIYTNVRYPEIAKEKGIEGVTVVKFVVEKDGSITDVKSERTIGGGCDEEALRVVRSFKEMSQKWIPGKQRGKNVRVQFLLPIKFKLEDNTEAEEKVWCISDTGEATPANRKHPIHKQKTLSNKEDQEIFQVVDEMPRFPGCEDITDKAERQSCSQQKMLEFIYKNLKYPQEARDAKIEGMVVIQFTIDTEGILENINAVRNIEGGCTEASLEVVHMMNNMEEKWIPGRQMGKLVKVMYTLPIKFRLDDKTNEETEVRQKDEPKESAILLLGNPVQGNEILFEYTNQNDQEIIVQLFDVQERMIKTMNIRKQGDKQKISMQANILNPGMYILRTTQGNEVNTKNVVVQSI